MPILTSIFKKMGEPARRQADFWANISLHIRLLSGQRQAKNLLYPFGTGEIMDYRQYKKPLDLFTKAINRFFTTVIWPINRPFNTDMSVLGGYSCRNF